MRLHDFVNEARVGQYARPSLHFVLFEQALIWIPGPTETEKGNKPQKQIHLTTKNPNHTKRGNQNEPKEKGSVPESLRVMRAFVVKRGDLNSME